MRKAAKYVGNALGVIFALYLIGRAAAEPFIKDYSNPASYRNDWGGPSALGVLAVHSGPGVLAAVIIFLLVMRRRRNAAMNT
ncbi:hypothetical protein [Melissospora conviva]|uniref:hypothetical protein n=1 Tax=Melissospora conviva TaxID=3388432 RepID=UPI003C198D4E